jgi:hypothetical protein
MLNSLLNGHYYHLLVLMSVSWLECYLREHAGSKSHGRFQDLSLTFGAMLVGEIQ